MSRSDAIETLRWILKHYPFIRKKHITQKQQALKATSVVNELTIDMTQRKRITHFNNIYLLFIKT